MTRISRLILIFSVAFTVFFITPAFLNAQFGAYPLMKVADVFDLLTPLVLLPLYWLLFTECCQRAPSRSEKLIFVALSGLWAMGQGMHLAANSIGHLLSEGNDVYILTYFYDEVLSHYIWHSGVAGLAILLLIRGWQDINTEAKEAAWPLILAGVIHGFTLFAIFMEGGTVPLGLPFVVILALVMLIWGRAKFRTQPMLFFTLVYSILALLFIAGWCLYWGGCPEPSQVGII
jgi:hypothetical protein